MLASSRLAFWMCLLAVVTASHAQRLDANRVRDLSGLVTMIGSLQQWRDICTSLFPSQATVIQGLYEASSVGEYAKRLGYELSSPQLLDRDKELESLGMSEGEASSWCLSDLPKMLDQFDELYGNRVQEMQDTFTGIEKAMAERPSNSPKPQQSPQPKELNDLFAGIVEASNRAYETGDWSVVADLYEPGTFDCWEGVRDAGQFAFLSFPPLSPNATFKVSKFTEYLMGGPYAFANGRPTHLMETSDELSRPAARCGLEQRQRWPRNHFFLVQRDNQFGLTHYCPSKEAIEAGTVRWGRPLSAAQTAANVAELTDADWEAISNDIKRDRYSPRSQERLVEERGFSYEEANAVIDYVCDPLNTP